MNLEKLLNGEYGFYGVDNNSFKLGRWVFEAIEDPSDGYRSMLAGVETVDPSNLIFFKRAVATVKVVVDDEIEGYKLVDTKDKHVWVRMGTEDPSDYYPSFVFRYYPKEG